MANNQQLLLGEGAGGAPVVYVEEVFSTYLYTGNGSTQTITNNIDLSTKGGLVWLKQRTIPTGTGQNFLYDSARGIGIVSYSFLSTDTTGANGTNSDTLSTFNSNGFGLLPDSGGWGPNQSGSLEASWTFRKQPKFFDVVTYTGDGVAGRTVAHTLGAVPGCIIVKRTNGANGWAVYHRAMDVSVPQDWMMRLNATDARFDLTPSRWNDTAPTSAVFTLSDNNEVNGSGDTYVAYLYAHDAGGFGLAGTDNVISCGSFTTGAGYTQVDVNLGYEPQWLMIKNTTGSGDWYIADNMRGFPGGNNFTQQGLKPNSADAEAGATVGSPNATGFSFNYGALSSTYIYIAIRRGPMKVPTVGTSVYQGVVTGAANFPYVITNTVVDFAIRRADKTTTQSYTASSRLTGDSYLLTTTTDAETAGGGIFKFDSMSGWYNTSLSATPVVWNFGRAPGFFDVVCYTGTGSNTTVTHNLGVVPEMMIVKGRNSSLDWLVYHTGMPTPATNIIYLNDTSAKLNDSGTWNATNPTSAVFSVGTASPVNQNTINFVAYLFATCAGVSKVGSYTGNGSSQTIACGFAAGSRWVMIKRTNSAGDWYVWDSARGIIAGNDPHLSLNTTVAEVTTDDSVDTDNSGFIVNQVSATNVNVTSSNYIFLAIA